MSNLEPAIAEWRRQMLTAGIKTPVPLEELEIHLREEIERQTKSGMSRQEAFDFAIQQIGPAGALRKEFGKVGEAMSARWRKFNAAFCGVVAVLFGLAGLEILFRPFSASPRMAFQERLLLSGAVVFVALILWSWRFSCGFFPVLSKRTRLIVAFLCVVLSGLCAALALRLVVSSANSIDHLLAAAAWTMLPLALAASIIFALEEAAYRKTAMSNL